MADLHRLEGNGPETGGILFVFSTDLAKVASWQSAAPVDPLEMAKACVAQVLDSLMKTASPGAESAIRETNWVSAVAGCQHHVKEWNARLRAQPSIPFLDVVLTARYCAHPVRFADGTLRPRASGFHK